MRTSRMTSRFLSLALVGASAAAGAAGLVPSAGAAPQTAAAVSAAVDPSHRSARGALLWGPGNATYRSEIVANINNAPAGSTIRAVTWTFSEPAYAYALEAADNRGVNVQLLVSKGGVRKTDGRPSAYLGARLNKDKSDASFLKRIENAGRGSNTFDGRGTALHQKSWTFSQTGADRYVTVVTSANMTTAALTDQANDAYIWVGDKQRFDVLNDVFGDQRRDRALRNPYRSALGGALAFNPWNSPSMTDPVLTRIRSLPNTVTIRIAMSAWNSARGGAIAEALVAKKRAGAKIQVVGGNKNGVDVTPGVAKILRQGGIPRWRGHIGDKDYVHHKFMTAEWAGNTRVWMGSDNWTSDTRGSDELTARIDSPQVHAAYVRHFVALKKRGGRVN